MIVLEHASTCIVPGICCPGSAGILDFSHIFILARAWGMFGCAVIRVFLRFSVGLRVEVFSPVSSCVARTMIYVDI